MSKHFSMGAINKTTNNYEYPKIASKKNKYKCPDCEKNVIFRNGKIKQPHFAHYKSNNPCSYYEKPNESQIHKDAKLLIKTLLDNKRSINIYRKCKKCDEYPEDFLNIRSQEYTDNMIAIIEYKFNYNNSKRSADVAVVENDKIKFIFEICYKNKTKEENRPEPWFEINAETFINETNSGENINEEGEIKIKCIRGYKCICCKEKEEYERKLEIEVKERNLEKNELMNMSKEDERTIRNNKKLELQKEKERIQEWVERKNLEEYWKHSPSNNERCSICNINYCKCIKSNFIKDEYNIIKCSICNKRKCKCVRITDFFK